MSDVTFDFSGKNFAVVGASSGIGRQVALELARSGAYVLAIGRNTERLAELAKESSLICAVSLDVIKATKDDWQNTFSAFVSVHGKLDGGVYAAGITGATPLKQYDKNLADMIFRTSFDAGVEFIHYAAKKKFSAPYASFVLFSSVSSYEGTKGLLYYASAKAAVRTAVKTISKEIGHRHQRINSISPAWVDTEMTRSYLESVGETEVHVKSGVLGVGRVEDVAGVVLFILSSRAGWITGQDFVVDGGYM